MSIEERLDRLEQQNRNLRRGLGGVLLLLAVPLACSALGRQDTKPKVTKFDTIEAKRIEAEIVMTEALWVRKGKNVIVLSATGDKAAIGLGLPGAKKFILLSVQNDTRTRKGGAWLAVADEIGVIAIAADEFGPKVQIEDREGTARAVLGSTSTASHTGAKTYYPPSTLTLFDKKGTVLHQVPK